MIKINLLGDDTAIDNSSRYLVAGYALAVLVLFVVFAFMKVSLGADIDRLTMDKTRLEGTLAQLKEKTKEVATLEEKRNELSKKLSLIAVLKKSKTGPVRVMDDLNLAVPERAWLSGVQESNGVMQLAGLALDNQTIAIFMKQLEDSDYFDTVDLVESKNEEVQNTKIKSFTIQAKINYAGKVQIADPDAAQPQAALSPAATRGQA